MWNVQGFPVVRHLQIFLFPVIRPIIPNIEVE